MGAGVRTGVMGGWVGEEMDCEERRSAWVSKSGVCVVAWRRIFQDDQVRLPGYQGLRVYGKRPE